jgi:aspartate aminotransferase-like enzyme
MISKLDEHLDQVEGTLRADLSTFMDRVKLSPMTDAAEMYVDIKNLNDRYEELGKLLGATVEELKLKIIPAKFESSKTTTWTSSRGFRVTISGLTRASMGENKEAAKEWLRKNGLGAIIQETVNASTLSATAKALLEEGKELDPDLFKTTLMTTTSVTKVKPKG